MATKVKKSTKSKFVPDYHHHTLEAVRKMWRTFMDATASARREFEMCSFEFSGHPCASNYRRMTHAALKLQTQMHGVRACQEAVRRLADTDFARIASEAEMTRFVGLITRDVFERDNAVRVAINNNAVTVDFANGTID